MGTDIIRLLLGANWGTAGWIFTFFAPAIGIMMVNGMHGWIHVSLGHADRWLRWGIFEWVITCSLFFVGLPWGPQGVAVAWCVSFWVLTLPAIWYAGRPIGLGMGTIVAAIWRYIAAALMAAVGAYIFLGQLKPLHDAQGAHGAVLRIVCVTLGFAALYLLCVVLLHGGAAPLRKTAKLMMDLKAASAAWWKPRQAASKHQNR